MTTIKPGSKINATIAVRTTNIDVKNKKRGFEQSGHKEENKEHFVSFGGTPNTQTDNEDPIYG